MMNEHPFTMTWTTADIPDLDGRTAVVTGANGGLGLETARALAAAGSTVVLAARSPDKTDAAVATIRSETPTARLDVVALDLGSLDAVRTAAATIAERHPAIDVLVNNAGLMGLHESVTVDGNEMQFGVNHLGHFLLTNRLLPALAAAGGRVVTVTSTAHHMGRRVDPANPNLEGRYGPWKAYGQSKLANYHFAIGLHERLQAAGSSVASLLAHPGLSNTDLQTHSVTATEGGRSQRFFEVLAQRTGMPPSRGALPQLRAATDPAARSGQFYAPRWVNSGPPVVRPLLRRLGMARSIEVLWEVSERLTGEPFDVAARLATTTR
jgi:NAD(P)-dependent dehydrogenase (short-subunit alcohol dehydrogenase family)